MKVGHLYHNGLLFSLTIIIMVTDSLKVLDLEINSHAEYVIIFCQQSGIYCDPIKAFRMQ